MPKDPRKAKGAAIETRDKTKRAPAKERTEGTEPAQVPSETFRAASRPEASVRLASQPPRSDLAPSIFIPFFLAAIKDRAHPFEPPPHDFDPLSATNAALESFGLPTRPDPAAEDQFLFWGRMLGPPLEIIRAKFPENPDDVIGPFFQAVHLPAAVPQVRIRRSLETSRNWSGVVVSPPPTSRFVHINGGWRVPVPAVPTVLPEGAVAGNDQEYSSSTWIGLGGHRPHPGASLPQIGTSQFVIDTNNGPFVALGAWWQWWVKGQQFPPVKIMNFPVANNHAILASVVVKSTNQVLFHIKNQTTGLFTTFLVDPPANDLLPLGPSAEWIMERPMIRDSTELYLLPHCTDAMFSNCTVRSMSATGIRYHDLTAARLIRMREIFPNPHRPAFVSQARKTSHTTARVSYHEAGL